MNRAVMFVGLMLLILGLAVVHFSLANAQPDLSPGLVHELGATHTPIPTNTPTPTPLPSAFVSPRSGSVGSTIRVSGSNFAPRERVRIRFEGEEFGVTANSTGSFSTEIEVPGFAAGTYQVEIGDADTFSFKITSSFSVTPSSGPPGTSVTVRASGFRPGSAVDITLDNDVLITANADNRGSILATVDIPSSISGGSKSIAASGSSSGDQTTFKVTATLSVVPSEASSGDTVDVTGNGFKAGERGILVTYKGKTVLSGISADSEGGWSESFEVPSLPAGSHTIKAAGSSTSSGDVRSTKLTLVSGLRIEPPSGEPGTVVRVSGSGAKSRERITVTAGGNLPGVYVEAKPDGTWEAELTLPVRVPGGTLKIVASDARGRKTNKDFSVTPSISLEKPKGFPGSRLILKGVGFKANQTEIDIIFGDDIVDSVSADPLGSWLVQIDIPLVAAGPYPISVPPASPALERQFRVTAGLSLRPGQGVPGETVKVVGSGFQRDEENITLELNDKPVDTGIMANQDGTWEYKITIPALSAGTYAVTATGSQTNSVNIEQGRLVIRSLLTVNTLVGTPGMTVNVSGRGFGKNESGIEITYDGEVKVPGISAGPLGVFDRSFVVPDTPSGTHLIDVRRSGESGAGNGRTEISFQIQPSITLEYPEGPPGDPIQITGSGFGANEQNIPLLYDGEKVEGVSADALGSFEKSFDIPASGAGTHSIQAQSLFSGATGSPAQDFTVLPSLKLSEIMGDVGQKVTVTGQGFEPESIVTLFFDDNELESEPADKLGSFRIDFPIPEYSHGDHVIRLLDAEENQQQISITIEDDPPESPSLLGPNDGVSGGFLGGFRPEISWEEVEDDSGVRYTLQIAHDRNFDDKILDLKDLDDPRHPLTEEEKLPRGDYFWRVKAVDKASNESEWSDVYEMKSGLMPIWLLAMLVALGLVATGGGAYAYLNSRRRLREEAIPPEFVRILQPEAAPALGAATATPALAAPAPTRRALPSPFRRPTRGLTPEERARLQQVVDFVGSIPLLEVSSDLAWMEEMIETMGGVKEEIYEQVLDGEIDLSYQPAWLQHPTYEDLRLIPQAEPFLQGLEGYIGVVNECASDTVVLLRRIAGDLSTAPPMETLSGNKWRFALSVGLSSLAWFRGTYLGQPSARDYLIQEVEAPETWDPNEPPPVELHGVESSPFAGLILNGLTQEDANFFRDLHIQLRVTYRTYEEARTLASKLAASGAMRAQITEGIAQLGQLSQRP